MTLTETEERIVEEAVKDPSAHAFAPVLFLGTDRIENPVLSGEWGQADVPITADLTLDGRIEESLDQSEARLYLRVGNVMVSQMTGQLTKLKVESDLASTTMTSTSYGALIPRTKLKKKTDYPGMRPHLIVRDAVMRVPYERGLVQIEQVEEPVLNFVGDEGFKGIEFSSDVLSRVQEQVPYALADTPEGGFEARIEGGLADLREEPDVIYRAEDIIDWEPPVRSDELYYAVRVYREAQGPLAAQQEYAYDPIIARIEYQNVARQAWPDLILDIPLNDDTPQAPQRAAKLAFAEALRRSWETHEGTFSLPGCDPRVKKGKRFGVKETFRDTGGRKEKLWACRVTAYKHMIDESGLIATIVDVNAGLLYEKTFTEAIRIPPAASYGVVPQPYGRTDGELFFSVDLPWVWRDGATLYFDSPAIEKVGGEIRIPR